MTNDTSLSPSKTTIVLNFLSVYIIWGSTYLAIKYAVISFPPLLMASIRFLLAGLLMYGIGRLRGEQGLLLPDKKIAGVSGILLVLGNGFVCIAEMTVPSGLTAIVIGTTPIFMMLLNWLFFEKKIPTSMQSLGILISLIGIFLLTKGEMSVSGSEQLTGVFLLALAILSWSVGTLMQRKAGKLPNIFTFSGIQLLIGSVLVLILGILRGEVADFDTSKITSVGVMALLYLVVFGSMIAFSSYIWISRHIDASKVSTYAVVNPVVAVWLGWLIADEYVDMNTISYSLVVLVGLYFVIKPNKNLVKPIAPTKAR